MLSTVATGSTWLFVPGDRPDRFAKAAQAGADQVIVDLEDAVLDTAKEDAREAVVSWLQDGRRGWVRVNGVDTPWFKDDLEAICACPGLVGIIVPKAESPEVLSEVRGRVGPGAGVVALVETARGVQASALIADSGHVDRLAFGSIDLALDLRADESDDSLLLARTLLVLASRAARLPGPLDGVTAITDDPTPAARAAARARSLGFGGKLCIHPLQIPQVASAFAPSEHEVEWALRVVAAAENRPRGAGAFTVAGEMVDRPVIARARAILAQRSAH